MAPQPIDSRLPQEPEVSLLTSAFSLPDNVRDHEKWQSGIAARNLLCLTSGSEGVICPDPERDPRDPPTTPGIHEFFPLLTWVSHGCENDVDDEDRWNIEANQALRSQVAWAMGRELWTGAKTSSASLQNVAEVANDDGLTPLAGIAAGLQAFEDCTHGAMATIHTPGILIPHLSVNGFFERKGNRLVTDAGQIVIPGPGYPTSGDWGPLEDPDDPESGQNAPDGKVWVYISGPVEAAEPFYLKPPSKNSQHAVRQNLFETSRSVHTIARFDTCCVFAVLVTLPV